MKQIEAVIEARARLIEELRGELASREQQQGLLLDEVKLLRRELRRELRNASQEPVRRRTKKGGES